MSSISNARFFDSVRICAAAAVFIAAGTTVRAVDYTWNGSVNSFFSEPANWTPSGFPNDNTDVAIFTASPESTYEVSWWDRDVLCRTLDVRSGDVSLRGTGTCCRVFTLESGTLPSAIIGSLAGPLAELTLTQGSSTHMVSSDGPIMIALPVGSHGKLTLDRAEWAGTSSLTVGAGGTGELDVVVGGRLTTSDCVIGLDFGAIGTVTIRSHPSRWSNTGSLTVGHNGTGSLTVTNPAEFTNDGAVYIAKHGSSIGTVLVTGTYALWQNNASFFLGGDETQAGGAATLTIEDGGTVTVASELKLYAGNALNLTSGSLNAGSLSGPADVLNWTAGTLSVTGGHAVIDPGKPLGNDRQIGSWQTLSVSGALDVGVNGGADLTIIGGGTVTSGSGLIGSLNEGSLGSTVLLSGNNSRWMIDGDLHMRSLNGADLMIEDAATLSTHEALIAWRAGTTADVNLTDPNTQWNVGGPVYLGGSVDHAGGTGELRIANGAEMHVADTLTIWRGYQGDVSSAGTLTATDLDLYGRLTVDSATVEVLDGTVNIIDADARLEGEIDIQSSAMNITGGGQFLGTVLGDGNTRITLRDADSLWVTTGSLNVGASAAGSNQIGTLTVHTGAVVTADGTISLVGSDALMLSGGIINAPEFDLRNGDFQGFGELNGRVHGEDAVITATGSLEMGDASHFLGFNHGGELRVGGHAVTLNSAGFARSGALTTVEDGGILNAPSGLLLSSGDSLVGSGTVAASLAAGFGSAIIATTGDFELGNANAVDGFFSDGLLDTGPFRVAVHDANEAVLGSLTMLGSNDVGGTVAAANGAVLEVGKNIVGFGAMETPNDPTKPLINNGAIIGISLDQPIEITGHLKGVGLLDKVNITGTDAPGIGLAPLSRGSVSFNGKLIIEIGGTIPGTQYGQVNLTGVAALGGELQIDLLDGFDPQLGDTFTIMTFATRTGEFATVTGRTIDSGLSFELRYNASDVTLVVTDPLAADCNDDGAIDLLDHQSFAGCITGPGQLPLTNCACFDLNDNGSVDLRDFGVSQRTFTGETD